MQDILIVVDMQNDFVDGSLGTPEAQRIVDHVVEKIMHFEGRVLFTQDTHESDYLETQEGVRLPVEHCIRGTKGWELVPAIEALLMPESKVIEKPTFGSSELVGLLERLNEEEPIRSITLAGLCTDICVISNALLIKAYFPEIPIAVDATCCAGVTVESHQRALDAMRVCQIDIVE
ncbi:MAG TPA: isochorismatase family cysteine hydrolase [Bacillota bacterium]|jgi:nicotinamidase-related amidase|nr:isochorismatase family cysteine hydrolase [Bacillota bacterium]HQC48310.1 isochorismatase family cysteine hydrolase [Bacillota bacterium]